MTRDPYGRLGKAELALAYELHCEGLNWHHIARAWASASTTCAHASARQKGKACVSRHLDVALNQYLLDPRHRSTPAASAYRSRVRDH